MKPEDFRPLLSENSDFLPEEPLGESVLVEGAHSIRVWQPKSRVLVLGRTQKPYKEIYLEAAKQDAIPVFRRFGGGGCVVLDHFSVCISLRYERKNGLTVADYLEHSCMGIADFLASEYDLDCQIGENYDLILDDKKFLGSSLYMPKGCAQYSAVMLFNEAALLGINRYLSMPSKEPSHRRGRSHEDFLVPLQKHISDDAQTFVAKLQHFMEDNEWTSRVGDHA